MDKIEIERKFLLKNLSDDVRKKSLNNYNVQCYYLNKNKKVWRERKKHLLIIKERVKGLQVRKQRINEINKKEFNNFIGSAESEIEKRRYFIIDEYAQTWYIDEYKKLDLIIAECEIITPDRHFNLDNDDTKFVLPITIPEYIKECIITEVTEQPEFYNYNLSYPIGSII